MNKNKKQKQLNQSLIEAQRSPQKNNRFQWEIQEDSSE
jgi:hypothetical protein